MVEANVATPSKSEMEAMMGDTPMKDETVENVSPEKPEVVKKVP